MTRNPDGDAQPWCHVLKDRQLTWEYCDVPQCGKASHGHLPVPSLIPDRVLCRFPCLPGCSPAFSQNPVNTGGRGYPEGVETERNAGWHTLLKNETLEIV